MDSLSGLKTASSRNLICATAGKAELLRNSSYTDFRLSTFGVPENLSGTNNDCKHEHVAVYSTGQMWVGLNSVLVYIAAT